MNELMQTLFELQSLEFEETIHPRTEARVKKLRAKIPQPILSHYDRLCASGKKGVALLTHQVCGGCHMRVPLAVVLDLMHGQDVRLCEHCGRYLFLREDEALVNESDSKRLMPDENLAQAH